MCILNNGITVFLLSCPLIIRFLHVLCVGMVIRLALLFSTGQPTGCSEESVTDILHDERKYNK